MNFYEVTSRGLTKVKTATGLYEASLPKDTWDTSTYAWYSSYSYSYGWGYSVAGSGCILLTSFDFKTAGYENNKENKKSNGIVTECNSMVQKQEESMKLDTITNKPTVHIN